MAFSDLEDKEKLDTIKIAVVDNDYFKNDKSLSESLKTLSDKNSDNYLFDISYTTLGESKKLLDDNKIAGYIFVENKTKVIVKKNGIDQTVLKYVVDQIYQYNDLASNVIKYNVEKEIAKGNYNIDYNKLHNDIVEMLNTNKVYLKDATSNNMNVYMVEFYTLIAMACLYGCQFGVAVVNNYLANMSKRGTRISVAPIHKFKMLLSGLAAGYLVELIEVMILILYTIFALKVDYGNRTFSVIILSIFGSLAGLSLGLAISSILKKSEEFKMMASIAVVMLGCFLSGMMGITMKYIVEKSMPIINYLNPANMITDGFYAIYYYGTMNRFYFNIISLLVFTIIMFALSYIAIRRQKYDNI
jgi:ABC-2 type transport system permease protein